MLAKSDCVIRYWIGITTMTAGVMSLAILSGCQESVAVHEQLARGEAIYRQHCASCHGTNLEGQPNWRQRNADGRLPAPPHDATGHTWHHSDEQLFRITKLGIEAFVGGTYQSDMRGFGDVLTDADIRVVLAYIKSTWPDEIRRRHDARNESKKQ